MYRCCSKWRRGWGRLRHSLLALPWVIQARRVIQAMSTDDDPTIEVSKIGWLDLLDFMGELGPSPGVTAGFDGDSSQRRRRPSLGLSLEDIAVFESPPQEVVDAVVRRLLRVARRRGTR